MRYIQAAGADSVSAQETPPLDRLLLLMHDIESGKTLFAAEGDSDTRSGDSNVSFTVPPTTQSGAAVAVELRFKYGFVVCPAGRLRDLISRVLTELRGKYGYETIDSVVHSSMHVQVHYAPLERLLIAVDANPLPTGPFDNAHPCHGAFTWYFMTLEYFASEFSTACAKNNDRMSAVLLSRNTVIYDECAYQRKLCIPDHSAVAYITASHIPWLPQLAVQHGELWTKQVGRTLSLAYNATKRRFCRGDIAIRLRQLASLPWREELGYACAGCGGPIGGGLAAVRIPEAERDRGLSEAIGPRSEASLDQWRAESRQAADWPGFLRLGEMQSPFLIYCDQCFADKYNADQINGHDRTAPWLRVASLPSWLDSCRHLPEYESLVPFLSAAVEACVRRTRQLRLAGTNKLIGITRGKVDGDLAELLGAASVSPQETCPQRNSVSPQETCPQRNSVSPRPQWAGDDGCALEPPIDCQQTTGASHEMYYVIRSPIFSYEAELDTFDPPDADDKKPMAVAAHKAMKPR